MAIERSTLIFDTAKIDKNSLAYASAVVIIGRQMGDTVDDSILQKYIERSYIELAYQEQRSPSYLIGHYNDVRMFRTILARFDFESERMKYLTEQLDYLQVDETTYRNFQFSHIEDQYYIPYATDIRRMFDTLRKAFIYGVMHGAIMAGQIRMIDLVIDADYDDYGQAIIWACSTGQLSTYQYIHKRYVQSSSTSIENWQRNIAFQRATGSGNIGLCNEILTDMRVWNEHRHSFVLPFDWSRAYRSAETHDRTNIMAWLKQLTLMRQYDWILS